MKIVGAHNLNLPPTGGNSTDLASVPPILWGFVASYGMHTLPAILHDKLCDEAKQFPTLIERLDKRREADLLFRETLRECGVPRPKRWVLWTAVRTFGLITNFRLGGALLIAAMLGLFAGLYLTLRPKGWWPASLSSGSRLEPAFWTLFGVLALVGFLLRREIPQMITIGALVAPIVLTVIVVNSVALFLLWMFPALYWAIKWVLSWIPGAPVPYPGPPPPMGPARY